MGDGNGGSGGAAGALRGWSKRPRSNKRNGGFVAQPTARPPPARQDIYFSQVGRTLLRFQDTLIGPRTTAAAAPPSPFTRRSLARFRSPGRKARKFSPRALLKHDYIRKTRPSARTRKKNGAPALSIWTTCDLRTKRCTRNLYVMPHSTASKRSWPPLTVSSIAGRAQAILTLGPTEKMGTIHDRPLHSMKADGTCSITQRTKKNGTGCKRSRHAQDRLG